MPICGVVFRFPFYIVSGQCAARCSFFVQFRSKICFYLHHVKERGGWLERVECSSSSSLEDRFHKNPPAKPNGRPDNGRGAEFDHAFRLLWVPLAHWVVVHTTHIGDGLGEVGEIKVQRSFFLSG
jgi:hypothetical protein